jgi:lysophospholipase L1-like esterase
MQWTFEERIDLQHPTGARSWPDLMMVQGDSRAHEWRVSVYDGGAAVDLTAYEISASFDRADGKTIPVLGTAAGNVASVVLPQSVYAVSGALRGVLQAKQGAQVITLASGRWFVRRGAGYDLPQDGSSGGGTVAIEVDATLTQEGKAADAKAVGDAVNEIETNMITAEEPTASEDVQSAVESILKSIEDKGNNILSQIQQTGSKKGLTVYCWGDSLTQGIGGNVNGWHLISYPQVLAERCNAVNLGILSDNVPTIMARMGADAIVLPACTIPGSSSESVVVGNTTDGMTLESGRIGKLLKYGDCGINPCYVNDVPCVLFRDYSADTSDGLSIRLRRLEDGLPVVVSAGTKLITFGAKHYKGNGLHIFWMGANGGYGSDAEGKNLDFSDYVAQLQKCVDYVAPADYLIIYARERKGYATDESAEVQELKETFNGHLIDLLPQLNDRGLLYGETNVWDGTLVKGVPKTLDSGDGCHYSFYGYMAIGKIIWEYVAPRVLNKTTSSGGTDTPDTPVAPVVDSDEIGKWAYKLKSPKNLISGSLAINTGFKPFAEGATTWTIAVKFADGLTAADATQWGTLMFCEVETSKTQLKIATLKSGTQYPECNVMCNSGGFAISTEQMGLTLYDSGYHTFVITKNDGDYTFYLDNNKLYNNKLGYPQAGNGDDPLYIGGWGSGWGMVKGTIMDVRIYNQCIDDAAVDALNNIFAEV